jgi:hypothetical protein
MALADTLAHLARRAGESASGYISAADVIGAFSQTYADVTSGALALKRAVVTDWLDGAVDGAVKMRVWLADKSLRHDFVIQRIDGQASPVTLLRLNRDTGALHVGAPSSPDDVVRGLELSALRDAVAADMSTWYGQIMDDIAATVTETVYRPAWTPAWATVHNAVLVRSGGSVALTADVTSVSPVSGANILGDLPPGFRPDAERDNSGPECRRNFGF